MERFKLHITS